MSTNPWTRGVLSRKFVELISVGRNAAGNRAAPILTEALPRKEIVDPRMRVTAS